MDIAQDASIIPYPYLVFQRDSELSGTPRASADVRNIPLTSLGVKEGSASNIIATTPEAIGVAILVPDFSSYPSFAMFASPPGNGVENVLANVADMMFEPYDVMSGFSSSYESSSPSSSRGP